uniref:ZZ-type domain-containing protein n=1 Tax=Panagrellus redivivus TaxID=6233 RepID=A0A7E4VIK8_PANRE
MFSQPTTEAKTGTIVITDMTHNAVKLALDFCAGKYLDAESAVDLVGVYTFADKYDITAVRQRLEKYFDTALTLENFLAVTMYAYQYSKDALFDKCAEYLARDSDVALLPGFQELDKDLIKAILAKASTFKKAYVAEAHVHEDFTCNGCRKTPIIGHRFTCLICSNLHLCQTCEKNGIHAQHALVRTVNYNTAVPDIHEFIHDWVCDP